MVVHESFVTRKPMEFTIIVLFAVFILLLPVYILTKPRSDVGDQNEDILAESYEEIQFRFSTESDLTESDKRQLFRLQYEGERVQWSGVLLACDDIGGWYRVSVDQTGNGFGDVLFTTFNNCSDVPLGSRVYYSTVLIDRKTKSFIGKEGEISRWD